MLVLLDTKSLNGRLLKVPQANLLVDFNVIKMEN